MGYTTDFKGEIYFNKPVDPALKEYINRFSESRHMKRDVSILKKKDKNWKKFCWKGQLGEEGQFYARSDRNPSLWNDEPIPESIINYNAPPDDIPWLWCHWIINEAGNLQWNGAEKFTCYTEWLRYLIKNFFEPEGYVLNGRIQYWGMDPSDWGKIEVHNNIVERFPAKCNAEFEGNVLKLSMPEWILAEIEKVAASKNVSVEYLFGRYIKWIALNPEQFKEWLWGGIMGVIRYQMEK